MSWKQGPLPPNTYGWGGIVKVGSEPSGFYFADFCGDHVKLIGPPSIERVEANQVAMYDNSLELPPNVKGRAATTVETVNEAAKRGFRS